MSFKYIIKLEEIEDESESKKMIKISEIGMDYKTKKASYSTDELLFYSHCIPPKEFLNKANGLGFQEEYINCKRELELIEAEVMVEISKNKDYTNESARKYAGIVYLNDNKTDKSKEYIAKRKELDKAFREKEIFTYLADYHKGIGKSISNHLFQNKVRDEIEEDLIKKEWNKNE